MKALRRAAFVVVLLLGVLGLTGVGGNHFGICSIQQTLLPAMASEAQLACVLVH